MITIKSPADAQDLLDLALEVQELERCAWKEALHRAVNLRPRLQCDVENSLLYWPAGSEPAITGGKAPEVHTCWSIPPRDVRVELPVRKTVEAA